MCPCRDGLAGVCGAAVALGAAKYNSAWIGKLLYTCSLYMYIVCPNCYEFHYLSMSVWAGCVIVKCRLMPVCC